MRMHLSLKIILGLLALKLQKFLIYIYKIDPNQLIALVQISQGPLPRPRREFHELYMPMSQVFEKLKTKGLLKPLERRPILNPLLAKVDVSKRCAYHQGPG